VTYAVLTSVSVTALAAAALAHDGGLTGKNGAAAPRLTLCWTEAGGPPVVPPRRRGFGSRMIERSLAQDLDGQVDIAFAPTGVICTVDAPMA
jgi:two-component sensor histidine kinase